MSSPSQLGNEDNPLLNTTETPVLPKNSRQITFLIGDDKRSEADLEAMEQEYEAIDISDDTETTTLDSTDDPNKESNILIELFDLSHKQDDEWVECARWVKYEEDVEGVNPHWGLPHVSCLFYENIKELGTIMKNAIVYQDMEATTYLDVIAKMEVVMVEKIGPTLAGKMADVMRVRQKHINSHSMRKSMTSLGISRMLTTARSVATLHSGNHIHSNPSFNQNRVADSTPSECGSRTITCLDSKESAQVYTGEISNVPHPQMIFVRLKVPTCYPEVEDNPLPVRFFVFVLGPKLLKVQYHEMGRSLCTMLANNDFRNASHTLTSGEDLVERLNRFLNSSVLLPPGEIDSKELIRVDSIRKAINTREKERKMRFETAKVSSVSPPLPEVKPTVVQLSPPQSGRFFKELRSDFLGRIRFYKSDFTDVDLLPILIAIIFLFLAAVAPAITFGGLMEDYTKGAMGVLETLWAMSGSGIFWSLLSAQPLIVVSPTGPVLIFEGCLWMVCEFAKFDLHTVRLLVGFFVMLFCLMVVAMDYQRYLQYVTPFTEDIFNTLISIIFLMEAGKFIIKTFQNNPVQNFEAYQQLYDNCLAGVLPGTVDVVCEKIPHPNTSLLSLFILFATFVLSTVLRLVRTSKWFGRTCRRSLGDFSVAIAVVVVAFVNHCFFSDVYVELLDMPSIMQYTNSTARGHGLIIFPDMDRPLIMVTVALIAAFLLFMIIFVETGLVEVLMSASWRRMRKPGGKAWDLALIGVLTFFLSLFGLPWMCPACVQSLAHSNCLTNTAKKAPGAPKRPTDVYEQRVSNLVMSIGIGLVSVGGSFMKIPMACLFGVFFYLGAMNLRELELFNRATLLCQPAKYHPKVAYVEHVRTWKMNIYTIIQLLFVAVVMTVKSVKYTAPAFPIVIAFLVFFRLFAIPCFFSKDELEALDGEAHHEPVDTEEALLRDPRVAFV